MLGVVSELGFQRRALGVPVLLPLLVLLPVCARRPVAFFASQHVEKVVGHVQRFALLKQCLGCAELVSRDQRLFGQTKFGPASVPSSEAKAATCGAYECA